MFVRFFSIQVCLFRTIVVLRNDTIASQILPDGSAWKIKIWKYMFSLIPSILTRPPTSQAERQAQTMTEPILCIRRSLLSLCPYLSLFFLFPLFFLESLFLFLEPRELLVKITLKNYKHYKKVLEAKHKEINTNFLNTNLTGHFSISLTPRHSNVFINNLKSLKVPFCTNFVLRFLFCV